MTWFDYESIFMFQHEIWLTGRLEASHFTLGPRRRANVGEQQCFWQASHYARHNIAATNEHNVTIWMKYGLS